MAYKIVNKKGRIQFGGEIFRYKGWAEQAIIDAIRGGTNERALKYYQTLSVRKVQSRKAKKKSK